MSSAEPVLPRASDRQFFVFNAVVSAAALSLLAWLLLFRRGEGGTLDLRFMPALNAGLNGLSATLLCAGYVAIRKKKPDLHKYLMVSAFASSALFLVGYLAYHYVHGDTKFQGQGPIRAVYFAILISHIVLSAVVLPLIFTTFWFSLRKRFASHRKIAKVTLPVWLYVSVTGVVIFFMLRSSY